jgi:hypothetical protein
MYPAVPVSDSIDVNFPSSTTSSKKSQASSGVRLEEWGGVQRSGMEWRGPRERHIPVAGLKEKPRRPEHKFNKKPARTKGTRGKVNDGDLVYDGGAMKTGKKGGLVRAA